jgi:hypothetical protein
LTCIGFKVGAIRVFKKMLKIMLEIMISHVLLKMINFLILKIFERRDANVCCWKKKVMHHLRWA